MGRAPDLPVRPGQPAGGLPVGCGPAGRSPGCGRRRGPRSLFHLWFHPYNVTADPDRALAALDRICAEAARLRDAGRLDTLTMGELAASLRESS